MKLKTIVVVILLSIISYSMNLNIPLVSARCENKTTTSFSPNGLIQHSPIRIISDDDLDNHTTITINSVKPIGYKNQYQDYTVDGWEIIDLRE